MSYEPYLIAAFTTGLDTTVQPWILPQDAFPNIVNAYIYKGVVIKRQGMRLFGKMVYSDDPNPKNPIMGIKIFIDTNNLTQLLIFDTKRAAIYNSGTESFDPLDVVDIFNGTPSSFINSAAFGKTQSFGTSTLYFTNFNGDTSIPISPMRSFTVAPTTNIFVPDSLPLTHNYIIGTQFIFAFRQRLLLLNTVESGTYPAGAPPTGTGKNYAQRVRWSRANNPTDSGDNWNEIIPGNGGFVDAPTSEQMIAATLLSDCIIVKFTNSVWVIEPTADPALPFRWVRINSFRACEAPYAEIEYDRYVISFGKRGIVACDRNEVVRVDEHIITFIDDEVNTNFLDRMYSARNFTLLHSWTLYPSSNFNLNPDDEAQTSNFALVRMDEENSWSKYTVYVPDENDPTISINMSCLGYGEVTKDLAYQDFIGDLDLTFKQCDEATWGSAFLEGLNEIFLGGDQIGRIIELESDLAGDDLGQAINLDLTSASWNPYKDKGIQCQMGYIDFYVDADTDTSFDVEFYCDDIINPYSTQTLTCLPNLGFLGEIIDITLSNPVQVNVAQNGLKTGDQLYIYNLSGADELTGGPYTITVIDDDNFTLNGIDGTGFSLYLGGGEIVQRAFANTKCWKRAYAGGKGYEHFIKIKNNGINDNLRINAFMPWFRPSGNRMIGG